MTPVEETLRILVLEDNPSDLELVQRELRGAGFNFTLCWAQDQATFIESLSELTPDLILADYSLPGFDAMAALMLARQRFSEIPVIIVSGAIGEETAIETLKAGATDYVLKQRLSRLGPVVDRAVQEASELLERRRAEQALRETSRRLATIIENSPLAMVEWDADFTIVRWTSEAQRAFGWTADDMQGRRTAQSRLFHPEEWPEVQKLFSEMKGGRRRRHITTNRNYHKDTSIIWCEWYHSALFDESGKLEGVISLALDVTEKIRIDEVLRSHVNLLQQAMLPAKPRIVPGYKVASYYVPAFVEEEVGGDFFDVFETEAGEIGILIGDVSGKGIRAAALAAVTRSTVRAFEFEMFSTGEALTHANKVLCSYPNSTGSFVTVHLAVLSPANGEIRYSSAGHPPPAIYRAKSGDVEWLEHGDLPIRLANTYAFRENATNLGPGDKMLLYTDGLSEARAEADLFGTEGIERTLKKHGRLRPKEVVEKLVAAAGEWTGGQLRDDTAMIVIEREQLPS